MHIVIATPEYPPHAGGGMLKFYGTLAPAYAEAGHKVTVCVANPFSPEFDDYENAGVVVRCVPLRCVRERAAGLRHLAAAPKLRGWLGASRALADAAANLHPDVVVTGDFGLACAALLCRSKAPVIVEMHGSLGQISEHEPVQPSDALDLSLARLLETSLLPHADDLQAYSALNGCEWQARLSRDITVFPPPLECPGAASASHDDVAVAPALVVGRIQPWKGPDVLCRALQLMGDSAQDLRVTWVGRDTPTAPEGGSLSEWLQRRYPEIWGDVVEAEGQRPYDEVRVMQATARFVIVPSNWDTFNFTAAEAMAAGRVVVCSDGVGASSLVADGVNGFVFRAGDARSLSDGLRRAVEATANGSGSAIGQAARATVAEQLNVSQVAGMRLERMRSVVSVGRRAVEVPDWLRAFVDRDDAGPTDTAFLANVSIRDLSRHVGGRLKQRFLPRAVVQRRRQ